MRDKQGGYEMDNVRFFPAMNKLWFVLAFGSCVSGALAQDLQPTPSNRLRSYVREFMASSDVPGMAVAVVRNGEPVHILALGRADLENDISAKDRSVFRWATITRMLTSVSILQLVERGELDLKAPIRKYVPEFRSGDGVTVEHLLANISGVRSINSAEELYNTRRYQRLADTLSIFVDHELLFEPGQRFRSSPFGYNLLGLVIE
ncbi:MAG: serine hydrolase domain-containing protein, partial [Phycisphaerae bacterium]